MAREALDTLLRLRRIAVHDQMRGLAIALRAEEQAYRSHLTCAETIARETETARSLAERSAAVAGFEFWRERASHTLRDAAAVLAEACEATRAARMMLGDARSAMRAVELVIEQRKREAELTAQRLTQHALDDATRRPGLG